MRPWVNEIWNYGEGCRTGIARCFLRGQLHVHTEYFWCFPLLHVCEISLAGSRHRPTDGSVSSQRTEPSRCHHCSGHAGGCSSPSHPWSGHQAQRLPSGWTALKPFFKLLMRPWCINTSLIKSLKKKQTTKPLHSFFTVSAVTPLLTFSHLVSHQSRCLRVLLS